VAAAGAAFVEQGYERPSLRGIARRAGVDPALVHHYFGGKAALFAEALKLGRDPREIALQMAQGGTGTDLALAFLGLWEGSRPRAGGVSSFVTAAQAVCSSPEAAAGLREFLEERVWSVLPCDQGVDPGERDLRRGLVMSQLMGMGWARYVLRFEPLASASVEEVARMVGPTLDRYMAGPLSPAEPEDAEAGTALQPALQDPAGRGAPG
jgi:AcrR family transcriptional regulator